MPGHHVSVLKHATGRETLLPDWLRPTGEPAQTQDIAFLLSQEAPPDFTSPLSTTNLQGSWSTWLLHAKRKSSVVAKNMDAEARLSGFESLLYHSLGLCLGKVIYISWGKVYRFPFASFTMCVKWSQEECLSHNAAFSDGYMS